MPESEYTIALYSPESLHQVIDVLQYLWGDDFENNLDYFKWKYDENPYVRVPLGVVASIDSCIVGFRGYFATKWHIPGQDREMIVLNPGDTVVHPDHRRKGLSVKMGRLAMEAYAAEYKIFFNHSATVKSSPGYLRMGFKPLLTKTMLLQYSLLGLVRFSVMSKLKPKAVNRKIVLGEFDQIMVSDTPRPKEMSALIANQTSNDGKVSLLQDEVFNQWRYNNKRNNYRFYYLNNSGAIVGYIVIRIAGNNGRRGYICDYASKNNRSFEKILQFILKKKHFDVVSISNLNIPLDQFQMLTTFGFREKSILRRINMKLKGVEEWPLFIRPVKRNFTETDWFLDGIDMREKDNWALKEICSDHS